jgi:hypothetical protein
VGTRDHSAALKVKPALGFGRKSETLMAGLALLLIACDAPSSLAMNCFALFLTVPLLHFLPALIHSDYWVVRPPLQPQPSNIHFEAPDGYRWEKDELRWGIWER